MFLSALAELKDQGMQSLIIDLRMNPGGYMDVMTNMADPLMREGVIYSERHNGGELTQIQAGEDMLGLPIAVLINEYTAGAGEYYAAALQSGADATLVGAVTAGFGYAQSRIALSDGSAMVLSSTEYYTPDGTSVQETGVTPDRRVAMSVSELYDLLVLQKGEDLQLNAAVALLSKAG